MRTHARFWIFAAVFLAALLVNWRPTNAAYSRRPEPKPFIPTAQDKTDNKTPAPNSQNKNEQKKAKDDQKREAKAAKIAAKREHEYQEIKEFAENLYRNDPEFRDAVDDAFDDLRRKHSLHAFQVNTLNTRDERVTYTGDKIKMEDTLYDNPLVQDYINRVGQSLVPSDSESLYAFKVVLNPVPEARSLSTGTVYISSGLLSLIDNEAQLAYILGHEIAHVEMNHWHDDALVAHGVKEYNEKKQKKKRLIGTLISAGAGAVLGGAIGGTFGDAAVYGALSAYGATTALKYLIPDKVISWDKRQEDEADKLGLQLMLKRNYDPLEAPKLFARLQKIADRDRRAQSGFIASAERIGERIINFETAASGLPSPSNLNVNRGSSNLRAKRTGEDADKDLTAPPPPPGKSFGSQEDLNERKKNAGKAINAQMDEIKAKLAAGELIASSGEFESLMADLKRDNGVRAFYYDMFQMARDNLSEALQIRSNDPYTHFYYGKLLHQTARKPADRAQAIESFREAIRQDVRRVLAEPHLYLALAMMAEANPNERGAIVESLKSYVDVYQQEHSGTLPPNMDVIYAYMKDAKEDTWVARPAMNVSTKGIEPIGVSNGPARTTQVVAPPPQPAPTPADPTPPKPEPTSNKKGPKGKP